MNPCPKETVQKKPIARCGFDGCNKKLRAVDWACSCNVIFCSIHRPKTEHQCIDATVIAGHQLIRCVADKLVDRI